MQLHGRWCDRYRAPSCKWYRTVFISKTNPLQFKPSVKLEVNRGWLHQEKSEQDLSSSLAYPLLVRNFNVLLILQWWKSHLPCSIIMRARLQQGDHLSVSTQCKGKLHISPFFIFESETRAISESITQAVFEIHPDIRWPARLCKTARMNGGQPLDSRHQLQFTFEENNQYALSFVQCMPLSGTWGGD